MNTYGVQVRNDDVMQVALYHTEERVRLDAKSGRCLVHVDAIGFIKLRAV